MKKPGFLPGFFIGGEQPIVWLASGLEVSRMFFVSKNPAQPDPDPDGTGVSPAIQGAHCAPKYTGWKPALPIKLLGDRSRG